MAKAKKVKAPKVEKITNPCHNATLSKVTVPTDHYALRLDFSPSTAQLTRYCEALNYKPIMKWDEEKGYSRPTFDKNAIEKLIEKYPKDTLFPLLERYRQIEKCLGTNVDGLPIGMDGRVHTEFGHLPKTGRLSSKHPNLQNQPREIDPDSPYFKVREMYVAAPGNRFIKRDFCVSPTSKILKTDLSWIDAETVNVGDELLGFDEDLTQRHGHCYRRSTVTAVNRIRRPLVRVVTTQGETYVSAEHKFVARMINRNATSKHNGKRRAWVEAQHLTPQYEIAFLGRPWKHERTFEAGWMSGFFDGEGWIHRTNVGIGQNPGLCLDKILDTLHARGFVTRCTKAATEKNVHIEILTNLGNTLRLLGTIRPERLIAKSGVLWEGRRTWGHGTPRAKVMKVFECGEADVISITTTTGTFISDGFFSHNCGIEGVITMYCAGVHDNGTAKLGREDAKLGLRLTAIDIHSFIASHAVGQPLTASMTDGDLKEACGTFKKENRLWTVNGNKVPFNTIRDSCKTGLYGSLYGGGPGALVKAKPDVFPTEAIAAYYQKIIFDLFPAVPKWHQEVCYEAHQLGYVRTPDGYRQYFSDVLENVFSKKDQKWRLKMGKPSKEAIAAKPQHLAMCFTAQGMAEFWERFPQYRDGLRLTIHDEILGEWPDEVALLAVKALRDCMEVPMSFLPLPLEWGMGSHLFVGTEAAWSEVGGNWRSMEKV